VGLELADFRWDAVDDAGQPDVAVFAAFAVKRYSVGVKTASTLVLM
jgi:hypothetical protein